MPGATSGAMYVEPWALARLQVQEGESLPAQVLALVRGWSNNAYVRILRALPADADWGDILAQPPSHAEPPAHSASGNLPC